MKCLILLLMLCATVFCKTEAQSVYKDCYGIIAECSDDSVVYHTKNGKEIRLKTNEIKYDGGLDSLKQDIYCSLTQDHEDNERTIFFVLFDRKHRISEIRMCSLLNKEPTTPLPYADDYIRAIAKTEKKWKTENHKNWYVAVFGLHVF